MCSLLNYRLHTRMCMEHNYDHYARPRSATPVMRDYDEPDDGTFNPSGALSGKVRCQHSYGV